MIEELIKLTKQYESSHTAWKKVRAKVEQYLRDNRILRNPADHVEDIYINDEEKCLSIRVGNYCRGSYSERYIEIPR